MDKKNLDFSHADISRQNSWASSVTIHRDLLATKDLVYSLCRFECSQPRIETQNAEYGAYVFNLNALSIRFRVAKITPTKVGQFVTLWERSGDGPIQPYDISDSVDLFVISTREGNNFGQFVFPKAVLCNQDIVSNKGKGGKRAIRVYPPWDKTTSRQAQKTQAWQLEYFLEIPVNRPIDCVRAQMLYSLSR
ncbi:MepB family protein [Bacillus toyonensis]|uniref:MepB family protein n=1 Tax=Bacillus toyonensis TaxID=155322 RepID=UPI00103B86B2|nr:MepB family protein [Bacillus toyonensis]MBF7150539.1 MepB family protein [Bacillus toyonensis]MEC2346964.1 MepB family protein [Bacillus toyonensis]MED3188664.1 MepB family protein [Bacillus toyonensis]TBX42482.1 MepB domain containing protein [Bacillus toyonensis]